MKRSVLIGIVLTLAILALVVSLTHGLIRRPSDTVDAFVDAYLKSDEVGREAMTVAYLQNHPVAGLLENLEARESILQCHTDSHAIGRALYRVDPNLNDAISQCGTRCKNGCFHGVLMGLFSTNSDTMGGAIEDETPEAYIAHVTSVAKDLCGWKDVAGVIRPGSCVHGLGHVFTYVTNYDLKKSIGACGVFRTGARSACTGGAFMEYMYSEKEEESMVTRDIAPCDAYPQFMEECFRYKARGWVAAWGGATTGMEACTRLTGDIRAECIRGVAYEAIEPPMLKKSTGIDWLCDSLSEEDHRACTSGAVMKVVVNFGGDAGPECDLMAPRFASICRSKLKEYLSVKL